jgi:DNA (cytosine-5)-methyltransferase 1
VFENVSGIKRKNLRAVQAAFEHAGYVQATRLIDARYFLPQSRERYFVIGVRAELGVDINEAMAALPTCDTRVIDILDLGVPCRTRAETAEVLALMAPLHLAKIEDMRRAGHWVARTYTRRGRPDGNGGKVQRAEVRDDEIAGALRTAAGGSSIQSLIEVNGPATRTRLLVPRECARLMGLAGQLPAARE